MSKKVDLSIYDNSWYQPGGNALKRLFWYFTNEIFFRSGCFPMSSLKVFLLRIFGAKLGHDVVIKPHVNIKYPWNLIIGNHVWIGEDVWIDNLGKVKLGNQVCLSQGAMLLSGNHNFKKQSFDLMVLPITIEDGAWVGAKSTVCPGVIMNEHSILTVGSIATSNLNAFTIYQGNPAMAIKTRVIL